MSMKVSELREALAAFGDQDAQVVIGTNSREWVKPMTVFAYAADLGRTTERSFFIEVDLPREDAVSDDDCPNCNEKDSEIEDLQDAIRKARQALEDVE